MKKKQTVNKLDGTLSEVDPNHEVLREPGQISFKEALKKVVNLKPKKNQEK